MIGRGIRAEQAACDFLCQQGLKLRERNYHCRRGELDLVMQHGPTLVFVEVRQRAARGLVNAAESVTRSKQKRLLAAARHYLMSHPALAEAPMRFDLIACDGEDLVWQQDVLQSDSHAF